MLTLSVAATALASALALISLGGGLYEFRVIDRAWPLRPDLIQPAHGGVSRRGFWMPAHVAFELALIGAFVVTWSEQEIRSWLLVGLVSHPTMRVWSAFDFIPKALAFERADPVRVAEGAAHRWTRRSRWRLPLDIVTSMAMLAALQVRPTRLRGHGAIRACWTRRKVGAAQIIAAISKDHMNLRADSRELAMSTKIFVNLPVKDLDKSMEFFKGLGFAFNRQIHRRNGRLHGDQRGRLRDAVDRGEVQGVHPEADRRRDQNDRSTHLPCRGQQG
jgi:hypothetical protein